MVQFLGSTIELSATGDTLIYSTYLGLSGTTHGNGIAVGSDGSAFITGSTNTSGALPTTTGAFQTSYGGGSNDAFVTKFSPDGSALTYSTYLGGFGADVGQGIALDSSDNAYITGYTASSNFPTASPYQSHLQGSQNAFLTKLSADGTSAVYSTYLGGAGTDNGLAVAVDSAGSAYVTGSTQSTNFPTVSAYQSSLSGTQDAFVSKFSAGGSSLAYSTYLGGSSTETGRGIGVDSNGQAAITGDTESTNFPTLSAVQSTYGGGTSDAFVTSLSAAGSTLVSSSFLGGSGADQGNGLAIDRNNDIYLAGSTTSTNFPTATPMQGSNAGGTDAFVSKFTTSPAPPVITAISPDTGISSTDFITSSRNITLSGTAPANSTVTLYLPDKGAIGTATANASGNWTFDYSGTTLSDRTYIFTARAAVGGQASLPSKPLPVTVDTTPASVVLEGPANQSSLEPPMFISGADLNGLPDGLSVSLDVDLNNDGNFTDAGETNNATGTLHNGYALIRPTGITGPGTYPMQAHITDIAGNTATSQVVTRTATTVAWALHGAQLRPSGGWKKPRAGLGSGEDPSNDSSESSFLGPIDQIVDTSGNSDLGALDTLLEDGALQVSHELELDQSSDCACDQAALIYNSATVSSDLPIVQGSIDTANNGATLPPSVTATLTWDVGGGSPTVTARNFTPPADAVPGDPLIFGIQTTAGVTATGRHAWKLDVSLNFSTPILLSSTGYSFVVDRDNSPYGSGWGLSIENTLVDIPADTTNNYPAGKLLVYGNGDTGFFSGAPGTLPFTYTSPADDTGTLVENSDNTFTYSDPEGFQWNFDSSGHPSTRLHPDGQGTLTYTYSGGTLSSLTARDGGVTTFSYSGGLVSTIAMPGSRTTTLTYSGTDLTQITNPDGALHTFTYDGSHRLTGDTFGGESNSYGYSAAGLVTTITRGVASSGSASIGSAQGLGLAAAGTTGTITMAAGDAEATITDGLGRTARVLLDSGARPLRLRAPGSGSVNWSRDTAGRVTQVTDALGRVTAFTRDSKEFVTKENLPDGTSRTYQYQASYPTAFHALTTFTDERGLTSTFGYDASGHRIRATDPLGQAAAYAYSAAGLMTTLTDPLSRTTSYAYDSARRETVVTDPLGNRTSTTYDAFGKPATLTDPLSRVTSYANDPMGRTTKQTDPLGGVTTHSYDGRGKLLTEYDTLGHKTSYSYDDAGRTKVRTEAFGTAQQRTTRYFYDAAGQLTATQDSRGNTTSYAYDAGSRLTQTSEPTGGKSGAAYDLAGQLVGQSDELGNPTSFAYDGRGRLTSMTDAVGNRQSTTYDNDGNVSSTTNALGQVASYVYDADNRQTVLTEAVGTGLLRRTTTAYDAVGNATAITDPLGRPTSHLYDALDRNTATVEAAGTSVARTSTTVYDAVGNVLQRVDALGRTTSYAYDALDRATLITEAVGTAVQRTSSMAYDAASNVTSRTDALGRRANYNFDALNRVTQTTEAVGTSQQRTTKVGYDLNDNLVRQIDALGRSTNFYYDSLNRQTLVKDALGNQTQTGYDLAGNVTSQTDALGRVTTSTYDVLNRAVKTQDALGNVATTAYDALGNVTGTVNPLGNRTTYSYDGLNRQTQVQDALGNLATTLYDAADNVTGTIDPLGNRATMAYDALNRATQTTDALNNLTTTVYDAVDNVLATVDARGNRTTFSYDALNRRTQTQDALTNLATLAYDAVDNTTLSIDPLGRRTTYSYDALNRRTQTKDALGNLATVVYDAVDNVLATADPLNHRTTYSYDKLNRVTQVQDALGNLATTRYDAVGNTTATVDPRGNRTTYGYDALNRQSQVQDALGNLATTQYDAAGNVTTSIDPRGNRTTFSYDAVNRQTQVQDALSNLTTTVYDAAGNVSATVDALGNRTTYSYDKLNRATQTQDALGGLVTTVYDAAGNTSATVDQRGNRTTYSYDALNRQTQTQDALGDLVTVAYDAAGNTTVQIDPLGHRTTFAFDALNRRTTTTNPLGFVTTLAYDAAGNVTQLTNARGFNTTYSYDALNRVTQTKDALGDLSTTVYDAAGNVSANADPLNHRTTYAYDALNRRTQTTDPLSHLTTVAYDAAGNVTQLLDALGNATTMAYDALNRQTAVTDPSGGIATTVYDAAGNVTNQIDQLNHKTTYVYDALNRRTKTIDALGFATTVLYDAASNVTGVIDPVSNRTTFAYDALNRDTQETDPFGHNATFAYDAAGRLTSTTDRLARVKNYSYDNADRLTGETWVNSGGGTAQTFTYTYDNNNNQLTAANAAGTDTMAYDAIDRVTAVNEPFGVTLSYVYDAASNRTVVQDSFGGFITSSYDAANRLTSRQFNGGTGSAPVRIDLAYSVRDQVTTLTRYADLAGTQKKGQSVYTYDAAMQLRNLQHQNGTGTVLANYTYTYDLAHRVVTETYNGANTNYSYDNTNQLTNDGTNGYSFDGNGNRTMTGYQTGTNNQVSNDGVWTYSYDAQGNLIKKSKGALAETVTYAYDHDNHLVGMTDRATDGGSLQSMATYVYDALRNRVEKDVAIGGTTTVTRFAYDGADVFADLNGSSSLTTRRVFLDGVDSVAARVVSGAVSWYLADRLGSVRNLTDSTGSLSDTITYDGFGKATAETSTANGDRYKYTGRELDSETGLQYHHARYYNPATGRWTTEDPFVFTPGDPNLYRYVWNDSTKWKDNKGLVGDGTNPWDPTENEIQSIAWSMWLWDGIHLPPNQRRTEAQLIKDATDEARRQAGRRFVLLIEALKVQSWKEEEEKAAFAKEQAAYAQALKDAPEVPLLTEIDPKQMDKLLEAKVAWKYGDAIVIPVPALKKKFVYGLTKEKNCSLLAGFGVSSDAVLVGAHSGLPTSLNRPAVWDLRGYAPEGYSSQQLADTKVNDFKELESLANKEAFLNFLIGIVPGGKLADKAINDYGSWDDAIFSALGDVGALLTFGASKLSFQIAGMALQGSDLTFRGYQLYKAIDSKDQRAIAEVSGKIVFRLLTFGLGGARLVTTIKNLKVNTTAPSLRLSAEHFPNGANDDFAKLAGNIPKEPGYFDLYVHTNNKGINLAQLDTSGRSVEVADMLSIEATLKASGWDGKEAIRLIACRAGDPRLGKQAAAQKIADFFGVKVLAPTEDIVLFENGAYVITNKTKGITANSPSTGTWVEFPK